MAGKTLDAIKARGQLVCGVNQAWAGFFHQPIVKASGAAWMWIYCKALAAAVLGDASKVKWSLG